MNYKGSRGGGIRERMSGWGPQRILGIWNEERRRRRKLGPGIAEHLAHAIKLAGRFS